jgi:hypothetical protein
MPRNRSGGVLVVTMVVGILAATVLSEVLAQFIDVTNVVHRVLLQSYVYQAGPATLSLIMVTFTAGFTINVNLLTVLAMLASFYYWKYRT